MPNVNPPQDRKEAIEDPLLVFYRTIHSDPRGYEIRVGKAKVADTLPEPSQFRFVAMITPAGDIWSGYLWREDGSEERYRSSAAGEGAQGQDTERLGHGLRDAPSTLPSPASENTVHNQE